MDYYNPPCYNYYINFYYLHPPLPLATGMNLYIRIDSIVGSIDSVKVLKYPDYINSYVRANDTINVTSFSSYIAFYYLSTSTLYISLVEIGTPQISGESYFCNYSKDWLFVMDDNCVTNYTRLFPGNYPGDTTRNCIVEDFVTNISESADINEVDIFPNPTSDFISIKSVYKIKEFEILNNTNEIVKKQINSNSINVTDIPAGIYIIRLTFDNRILYKKIIKI